MRRIRGNDKILDRILKMTLLFNVSLHSFYCPSHAQQKINQNDSLKSVLSDTVWQDSTRRVKIILDSIRPKPIRITPKLKEFDIDTMKIDEAFLDDKYIPTASEIDTVGKILLPISLKKDKFAYFDATQSIDRIVPNQAFKVGEKLTFIIRYGPIVAGSSTMAIPEIVTINGSETYRIVTEAKSSAFFSAFFKVRDKVESYIDKDGLFTWRFEKHLREGNYRSERIIEYDQINGWVINNNNDSLRIPPCVQDVLSSFYYVRTQQLEVGKSLFIDNHADDMLYPLEVKVHKKERVKVKAGEFDCVVIEPILRASGLFSHKGRLIIWLTDDERKIPVQMKSKIFIGYITAELEELEGIKEISHVGLR